MKTRLDSSPASSLVSSPTYWAQLVLVARLSLLAGLATAACGGNSKGSGPATGGESSSSGGATSDGDALGGGGAASDGDALGGGGATGDGDALGGGASGAGGSGPSGGAGGAGMGGNEGTGGAPAAGGSGGSGLCDQEAWTQLFIDGESKDLTYVEMTQPRAVEAVVLSGTTFSLKFNYLFGETSLSDLGARLVFAAGGIDCSTSEITGTVTYTREQDNALGAAVCGSVEASCADAESGKTMQVAGTFNMVQTLKRSTCSPDEFGLCVADGNEGACSAWAEFENGSIVHDGKELELTSSCSEGASCSLIAADGSGEVNPDAQFHCACGMNGSWNCQKSW